MLPGISASYLRRHDTANAVSGPFFSRFEVERRGGGVRSVGDDADLLRIQKCCRKSSGLQGIMLGVLSKQPSSSAAKTSDDGLRVLFARICVQNGVEESAALGVCLHTVEH